MTNLEKLDRHEVRRHKMRIFIDQLRRARRFEWRKRALTRLLIVGVLRHRRRFDDLGPYLRLG
jgi:hypothetical protein